jgi:integrase
MASSVFKVTVVSYWLKDTWLDAEDRPCPEGTLGAHFVKRRRVPKSTAGAHKAKHKSTKWYGRLPGSSKPIPLSANKTAAQQMLAALVKKAELGKVGIVDPFEQHRGRPLAEHLADFEADLWAKGNTTKQVRLKIGRIRRVVEGCGFVFIADLSASRVQQYLADLRRQRPGLAELDPGQDWYTRNELATALGVRPGTIKAHVQRHRLAAEGNGKARRYPRSTAEALHARLDRGTGQQTANYYLREIKAFVRWLQADRRMEDNPLAHLKGGDANQDRRRNRRPLDAEELQSIISSAWQSPQSFRGLTGNDRAMLYCVACATGFRAEELSCLRTAAFDLDGDPPTVTLRADQAKNGKTAVQPLPPDLADSLRGYLAGRPVDERVWPGTWFLKAADMLRIDLDAAGIPYIAEGPDGPRYADFHALRHSFIAMLDKSGATLKEAMQLARHSDPKLTMAIYGRAQLHDLGEAVKRLPALTGATEDTPEAVAATGTDGKLGNAGSASATDTEYCANLPFVRRFVQTNDSGCEDMREHETAIGKEGKNSVGPNRLMLQEVGAECEGMLGPDGSSGGRDRTGDTRLMKPLL